MPYKVHKMIEDRRNHTCGFLIPNGGWYHVVEMTFENHDQLQNIGNRNGYSVDFVKGSVGMFDPEGNEVDPSSIVVDKTTKHVTSYKKINEILDVPAKKVKHKGSERENLIETCRQRGVAIDKRWSTQKIKEVFERSTQRRESTLAI